MSKCIMARNALASPDNQIPFKCSLTKSSRIFFASASDINLLQLGLHYIPFDQTDSNTALISVSPYSYSIALPYAFGIWRYRYLHMFEKRTLASPQDNSRPTVRRKTT